jgi:hypothetical protein
MTDNLTVKDAGNVAKTLRSTDKAGVHIPHHIIEQGDIIQTVLDISSDAPGTALLPANPDRTYLGLQLLGRGSASLTIDGDDPVYGTSWTLYSDSPPMKWDGMAVPKGAIKAIASTTAPVKIAVLEG